MRRFEDDDDGYLHWLGTHPDLHVLNTARNPTPAYLVLHRATCHTISGTPARGTGRVAGANYQGSRPPAAPQQSAPSPAPDPGKDDGSPTRWTGGG